MYRQFPQIVDLLSYSIDLLLGYNGPLFEISGTHLLYLTDAFLSRFDTQDDFEYDGSLGIEILYLPSYN